ncbi:glycosyltransferase family 2 protein [Microbacterium sp. zg-Y818]|uniref:glycosyltransferase family 2 protein n=1 Tax=Microbacterium sp. zg-Y818 TaxID=3049072 RepID=UPI003312F924
MALIVNYNSSDDLLDCVASMAGSSVDRVLILDNASVGSELDKLSVLRGDPRFHVLRSERNTGFGAGVNALVEALDELTHAGCDPYLWIVNPDCVNAPRAAELLRGALDAGEADVVFPIISDGTGERVWFAGGAVDWKRGQTTHRFFDEPLRNVPVDRVTSMFVCGANFMVRRSAWERVGKYDESLFLYWEDADWSERALRAGLRLSLVPTALAMHAQGGSSGGKTSPTYYYYAHRNRLVLGERYGANRWSTAFGFGLVETVRLLLRPLAHGQWRSARASVAGLLAGLRLQSGQRGG